MNKGQGGKLAVALVMGSAIAVLVVLQISSAGRIARAAALGTPNFGPAVTVYSDSVDNGEPVVAYSPVHDEYLVVWEDYNAGEIAIYGRLVNSDGVLTSGRISIAAYATYTSTQPAVAYSPVLDQYLVVYTTDSKPSGAPYHDYDLIARVVNGDGTLGDALLVNTVTSEQTWHPSVAYNSQDDEFLVAWEIEHGSYGAGGLRTDIYARRIYSNTVAGSWVLTTLRCVVTGDPGGGGDGRDRVQPDVAYNSTNNEYLIAYTREG